MRKIAVLFGAAAIVASGLMVAPAHAGETNIVEEAVDEVRARVCRDEHGYGVVDCSQEVDPIVEEIGNTISPVTDRVFDAVRGAVDTAREAAEEAPGTVKETANYVYCWMVDPTNPYCSGPID